MRSPLPQSRPPATPSSAEDSCCREWYEAHGTAVYGFFRFHLTSAEQAEDLTAEVFLRAVRAAKRFDPARGSGRGWLLRIARNLLHDHFRRERRRPTVSLEAMQDLRSDTPSPEERMLWEEEVARLLAAVAELAPADREIVGLRYGSGLGTAEVAEILGIREPVARTRLWRALARLRRVLVT